MAEALKPLGGEAVVELRTIDGTLLPSTSLQFISAACEDAVMEGQTWAVKMQAVSRAAYENLIIPVLLSKQRRVKIRWGLSRGTEVVWGPFSTCCILTCVPELHATVQGDKGYAFQLTLGGLLKIMDLADRIISRSGVISAIVASVISAHPVQDSRIEPTSKGAVALIQSRQSDFQFLRRLAGAALNTSGAAGYYLYTVGDVLHFHTRNWQQSPLELPYNMLESGASMLIGSDQTLLADTTDLSMIVCDPLAGRTEVMVAETDRYLRFAARLPEVSEATILAAHVGPNQSQWARAVLQARYAWGRDRYQRIVFILSNVVRLDVGAIVRLSLPDPGASSNGYYFVEKITTTIDGAVAKMVVTASRGEIAGRSTTAAVLPAGTAEEALPVPAAAPGVDPNFQTKAQTSSSGNASPVQPADG